MNWQPIETAPEDGEFVLVSRDDDVGEAYFKPRAGLWCWPDGREVNPPPTHWMPLPRPAKDLTKGLDMGD